VIYPLGTFHCGAFFDSAGGGGGGGFGPSVVIISGKKYRVIFTTINVKRKVLSFRNMAITPTKIKKAA
jgi:hypothetical protein